MGEGREEPFDIGPSVHPKDRIPRIADMLSEYDVLLGLLVRPEGADKATEERVDQLRTELAKVSRNDRDLAELLVMERQKAAQRVRQGSASSADSSPTRFVGRVPREEVRPPESTEG